MNKSTSSCVQHSPLRLILGATLLVLAMTVMSACGNGNGSATDDIPDPALPAANGDVRILLRTGMQPPDGRGRLAGLSAPVINNRGEVLVEVNIDGPGDQRHYDTAVLLIAADGNAQQLVRTGQSLPDGERFGWLSPGNPIAINHIGQVVLWHTLDPDWNERNAIYRIDTDGTFVPIFNVVDHDYTHVGQPLLNNQGQILFEAWQEGDYGRTVSMNIYRVDPDGTRVRLFGVGDQTPDGDHRLSAAIRRGKVLTEDGWSSFFAAPNPIEPGGSPTAAFYRTDGSGLVELIRRGEPTGAPGERVEQITGAGRDSALDAQLRTVFEVRTRTAGEPFTRGTLFMHTATGLVVLARERDAAPGGGFFGNIGDFSPSFSDNGEIAFRARLADRGGSGIYLGRSDGTLEPIGVPGQAIDGGGHMGDSVGLPIMNASGQVFFDSRTETGDFAIFVGQAGSAARIVVREGQSLAGSQVQFIRYATNEPHRSGFNDHGQVAIQAHLDDGDDEFEAIVLIGPAGY